MKLRDRLSLDAGYRFLYLGDAATGATATVVDGATTLRSRRVIPDVATTTVFDWTADADISGGFRIDETVAGGAQTYLHVLSFGNTVTTATRSDAGGRQGVLVELADDRDVTVRFSPTGVDGTITITAAGGGTLVSAALTASVPAVPELAPG